MSFVCNRRRDDTGSGALWRACLRFQSVVSGVRMPRPSGICILELLRCCSFSVCRIVYLEQLHRLAGTINLTGVPRIPLPLTLPLARAKEDSAATHWVTSAIPARSGGQRVAPRSSSLYCNILSNLKHLTMAITRANSAFSYRPEILFLSYLSVKLVDDFFSFCVLHHG